MNGPAPSRTRVGFALAAVRQRWSRAWSGPRTVAGIGHLAFLTTLVTSAGPTRPDPAPHRSALSDRGGMMPA